MKISLKRLQRNLKLKTAIRAGIFIASIAYPFALFFANRFSLIVIAALGILWTLRGILESGNLRLVSFLAAAFFGLCLIFKGSALAFLYPVLVSLGFLAVFAYSLKNEAIITKIARLKEANLNEKVIAYTRNLTKIWCGFFIFNAALALFLSILEDKNYWSVYTGVISYLLMGALFGGEILYRKIFILRDGR